MNMQGIGSLCSLLLAVGLLSCGNTAPTKVPTAMELRVARELDTLRSEYAAMRLPASLARARRLGPLAAAFPDSLGLATRAEVYQYLAQLHFHHYIYVDSVNVYTRRADSLLPADASDRLRAQQLLCAAYNGWEDWTWVDMQLQAQLGQRLLERAGERATTLYGLLQSIEARATKKQGDSEAGSPGRQVPIWREGIRKFRRAVTGLHALDSPWENYAREHLTLSMLRTETDTLAIRRALDTLAASVGARGPDYGYLDRVLGYWHLSRGNRDSSRHYYTRMLAEEPLFLAKRTSEARFALEMLATQDDDFAGAFGYAVDDMVRRSCCPDDYVPKQSDEIGRCDRRPGCIHFVSGNAELLRQWYAASGDPAHGLLAIRQARQSVEHYESTFRNFEEQTVHNKNLVLGDRLIASSLRIHHEIGSRLLPRREYHDVIFRSMELGKTIVLTREIAEAAGALTDRGVGELAARLRNREDMLEQVRDDFTGGERLELARLEQFDRLLHETDRLRSQLTLRQTQRVREGMLPVAETSGCTAVRESLRPDQALLEFAETDTTVYALYADRDTSVVYTLSLPRLDTLVDGFMGLLTDSRAVPVASYAAAAQALYDQLLGPVGTLLARRTEVIVAPSAGVSDLPLAALVDGPVPAAGADYADLPYLVHRHAIRYVASWRAERYYQHRRKAAGPPRRQRVGAWTHPDLQGYLGGTVDRLLRQTATDGRHFELQQCTRTTFLRNAQDFDWLQLSVHATSDPTRLHENYLHLNSTDSIAGPTIGGRVLSARLVVLAACSTSRGVAHRWEGTYSLRRSFHQAGVPDVVASLYDIPALATADLLNAFYENLMRGCDPAAALARAQRACALGRMQARHTRPGAWAGLILG